MTRMAQRALESTNATTTTMRLEDLDPKAAHISGQPIFTAFHRIGMAN